MKRITAMAALLLFVLSLAPTFAAGAASPQPRLTMAATTAAGPAKTVTAVCPVTGAIVSDIKKAPKSVYKGKTYYFCCTTCKAAFDKNPEKYIKKQNKKAAVICPVRGVKVANLSNAPKSVYKGKTYYFCCKTCKAAFDKNPGKYLQQLKKK